MLLKALFVSVFILFSSAFTTNNASALINIDIDKVAKNVANDLQQSMKGVFDDTIKNVQQNIETQVGGVKQEINDKITDINSQIAEIQKIFYLIVKLLIVLISAIGFIIAILFIMLMIKFYNLVKRFYRDRKDRKKTMLA